jgi:Fur family ferric uptake transcriptional regulator
MQKKNKELQKAGLKATLPRIKILEVLDAKGHLSAEDIYKELILMDEM